jgi:hypothetical protein|tara:strand:+ start:3031 stop:3351 length:321 start_codon:yes stop_codon:yes gene_type:complete
MAYKMKMGKLSIDNTPIYQMDTDEGVMGMANKNGSIIVDKDLSPLEQQDVVRHEQVHLDQMKRGDLDYDDKFVYWKGKKVPRSTMDEGGKNLPWEKEAYKANKLKT